MKARRIAITGGIATGKSTVAKMLAEAGAVILDADKVARDVVRKGTPCLEKLRELLGPSFFRPDGALRRRKLRNFIVGDKNARLQVNAILHPHIGAAMEKEFRHQQSANPSTPVIFDIPLFFEGKLSDQFDIVILVYIPAEKQIERLMARDKLTRAEAERTLTMQLPIEAKKALAQIVIDNSLDLNHTRKQVRAIWDKLKREAEQET
ncbi:MAG: dephospho-CoA kinase [Syntrophobacteraceae bacterium]